MNPERVRSTRSLIPVIEPLQGSLCSETFSQGNGCFATRNPGLSACNPFGIASGAMRSADFQVCCGAGFQTCWAQGSGADLEVGDTEGLETCATQYAMGEDSARKNVQTPVASGLRRVAQS